MVVSHGCDIWERIPGRTNYLSEYLRAERRKYQNRSARHGVRFKVNHMKESKFGFDSGRNTAKEI